MKNTIPITLCVTIAVTLFSYTILKYVQLFNIVLISDALMLHFIVSISLMVFLMYALYVTVNKAIQ